jgi:hypothetical protein
MLSNQDKGKKLELIIAERLQEIFKENPPIRVTRASSGGSHNTELADINSQNVYVECKNQKGKFFSKKVWQKLLNQIPLNSTKVPLYIINDEVEGKLVMLTFNDLCRLLKERNE